MTGPTKEQSEEQIIAYKKQLNDARSGFWSFLDSEQPLTENAELTPYFHKRNHDANIICIMNIVSMFAEKEGYEAFARRNPDYTVTYEGFDPENAVHEYTYNGQNLNVQSFEENAAISQANYWSGVNQQFLSDFVAFASQDTSLTNQQRTILSQAKRAININNNVIPVLSTPSSSMQRTANIPPPSATTYNAESATFNAEAPIEPELYDLMTPDLMQSGIDHIQAVLAARQEIFAQRIRQLVVRTKSDIIHPSDAVGDYEQVKGNDGQGIKGIVAELHQERLDALKETWGASEARGYIVFHKDHEEKTYTPYFVDPDGNIFEWDETSNADDPSFNLDQSVGNIMHIDADNQNGEKAHVATAALLFEASALDPDAMDLAGGSDKDAALTSYQRRRLTQLEAAERDILERMGVDSDYARDEIVQRLHQLPFFAEDAFGVDADKDEISGEARKIILEVTGKDEKDLPEMDDLMFVLIAQETQYRGQAFYPDYTGMYLDNDYARSVNLALMSDIVEGAATGQTPDSLASVGVKPETPIIHDNYYTQEFHELVDNNGGFIPAEVNGSLLGIENKEKFKELLGSNFDTVLGENYADKTFTRQQIKQLTRMLVLGDAEKRGITNISEAMLTGEFCPHIEYLRWAYTAPEIDPDYAMAGPEFYQLNEAWNKDFGSIGDINGNFDTMIGGRMQYGITIEDYAAHKFMRIMPAVHPDRFPELMDARNSGDFLTYEEIKQKLTATGNTQGLQILESEVQNSLQNQSVMTFALYSEGTKYYNFRGDYNAMRNDKYLHLEAQRELTQQKRTDFGNEVAELTQKEQPHDYVPTIPTLTEEVTTSASSSTPGAPSTSTPTAPSTGSTGTPPTSNPPQRTTYSPPH